MTPTYATAGRQRLIRVPRPAEYVPPPPPPDPPIYRDLLRAWAERGRTLPGRHDPEWVRLSAPTVLTGQFSDLLAPPGDGR
ncbi:hypothetical protein GCM10018980_74590 [Streptomyces capoamus]|uniref:Uncharacterized protein n=1 Tax=Streptomyces capoamus TaxID=68183 RepID=A0A919F3L4_9ACTN|nr:hypothetical protein GCM10010501_57970 [Streptomyces libani subsp. rufus]GHG76607.1 hypothetical protein GCM10018980_74590 [Streptomyces capoamus]